MLDGVEAMEKEQEKETGRFGVTGRKKGLPWWLSSKESAYKAGDVGSVPGWGRSSGEGNSNPLQYSCLGNPMDRRAWRATVHGVPKELDMT